MRCRLHRGQAEDGIRAGLCIAALPLLPLLPHSSCSKRLTAAVRKVLCAAVYASLVQRGLKVPEPEPVLQVRKEPRMNYYFQD